MIRSSSHAPTEQRRQRGFVLVSVLVLAALYLGLIALLLWESGMKLRSAQRFRNRVVAQTLATNAVELSARGLASGVCGGVDETVPWGELEARCFTHTGEDGSRLFEVRATGKARGVMPAEATVVVWGRVSGGAIKVVRTRHSQ